MDFFKIARRMGRYSSAHIETHLTGRHQVNEQDAAAIVAIAKNLSCLEKAHGDLSSLFIEAWCQSGKLPEFAVRDLVAKHAIEASLAQALVTMSRQLGALDIDQTDINAQDSLMGFS